MKLVCILAALLLYAGCFELRLAAPANNLQFNQKSGNFRILQVTDLHYCEVNGT
jgi:hypothetical protein